jgi:hypothetical protein
LKALTVDGSSRTATLAAHHTSIPYTLRLADAGADASVGDSFDMPGPVA